MAEEIRRRLRGILEKLPEGLRNWIAENPEEAARSLRFLARFDKELREIMFRAKRGEALTDEEYERFVTELSFEDQAAAMRIPDEAYRVSLELEDPELRFLAASLRRTPDEVVSVIEELAAPPPPQPPAPPPAPPAAPPAAPPPAPVPERRFSARWRSWWPQKTGEMIRDFMLAHGGRAHPYEVYDAYRRKVRREIMEDHATLKKYAPEYHISEFRNFWRYFDILEKLGVIRKVGEKTPSEKAKHPEVFRVQYYEIVPGMEDSPIWRWPQLYLYPLSSLGRRRFDNLKKDLKRLKEGLAVLVKIGEEREEIGIRDVIKAIERETGLPPDEIKDEHVLRWLFAQKHTEWLVSLAEALGVDYPELRTRFILTGRTV